MEEGFVEVNSVPTHIFCWGQYVTDSWDAGTKEIVLVVTGNPGLGGFYTSFCSTLFEELDQKIPVWCIGHAGHDEPKPELGLQMPPLEGNGDLYNLQGQVNHKADFIRKFVPPGVKVHIIAHSIGTKISLELLKDDEISEKVHQGYLLFPTIERMMITPNGSWFCFFDRWFFPVMQFFYYAFSYLPLIVRTIVLYAFCWISGYPEFFLGTVIKLSSPTVIDKIWFMSKDEMDNVCEIDNEFGQIIKQNMHRLKFYYGTTDGWVPVDYYKQLVSSFPGIDAELCTEKIDHGFVISHGPRMARMVSDWVRRKNVANST